MKRKTKKGIVYPPSRYKDSSTSASFTFDPLHCRLTSYYITMKCCLMLLALSVTIHAYPRERRGDLPIPLPNSHRVARLMDGARNFSLQLLRELDNSLATPYNSNIKPANIVFSPLGVANVLGLLRIASKGITKEELDHLSLFNFRDDFNVESAFQSLYRLLMTSQLENSNRRDSELINSNMIFLDYRMQIYKRYYKMATVNYSAKFQTADFRDRPEASRRAINAYVDYMTSGYVPNLLSLGDVTDNTEVVFANTVFFKSRWLHEFNNERTRDENFTLTNRTVVKVPTMRQMEFLNYRTPCRAPSSGRSCGSESGPDMVELPFRGERRKFYVILPNERISLRKIEAGLAEKFDQWKADMTFGKVDLKLPKFKMVYKTDLKHSLRNLGLETLFWGANLEALSPDTSFLSTFTHKAMIDVSEGGVAAGAGSGVVTYVRSAFPTVRIHVDRPFLFYVEDVVTHALAFLGKVSDPRSLI